jgi:hypothetical protein
MEKSRPTEWIEEAEARRLLTIARYEEKPAPIVLGSVRNSRRLMSRLGLLLPSFPTLSRSRPVRVHARIRRAWLRGE